MEDKKKFVAYLDEDDNKVKGKFWVLSVTTVVTISTGQNIITFPLNRLLKIKENNEVQK